MPAHCPIDHDHATAYFGPRGIGVSYVVAGIGAELLRRGIATVCFDGDRSVLREHRRTHSAQVAGVSARLARGRSGLVTISPVAPPPQRRKAEALKLAGDYALFDLSGGAEAWLSVFPQARPVLVLSPAARQVADAFEFLEQRFGRHFAGVADRPEVALFVNRASGLETALRTFRYFAQPALDAGWRMQFLGFAPNPPASLGEQSWSSMLNDSRSRGAFAMAVDRLLLRPAS